jgi:hypothetical protein
MEEGHILDQGEHFELMNRNEQYSTLINTFMKEQGQGSEEESVDSDTETLVDTNMMSVLAMESL